MDTQVERAEKIELGFGNLALKLREFEFRGYRGSTIRKGEDQIEVSAATGIFRVSAERFIKSLGDIYFKSLTGLASLSKPDSEEEFNNIEAEGEAENEQAENEQQDVMEQENEQQGSETEEQGSEGKGNGARIERPASVRFRGERIKSGNATISTVCLLSARQQKFPGVRFTVVQAKIMNGDREVIARTTGVITPYRLMALIDISGGIIRQNTLIYPLGSAVLVVNSDKVTFQSGTLHTELEKWQEAELKYLLAGKFFAPDLIKVNFRAGRVRIEEVAKNEIVLTFGGVQNGLTPGDLFVLWAVLK